MTTARRRLTLLLLCALAGLGCVHPRVTIVGGGVAGLVAARELEHRGISVQILEQNQRLGGRVASVTYGPDAVAEAGMQELWEKSPLTVIARGLGLTFDQDTALSSVVLDGVLVANLRKTNAEFLDLLFTPQERAEERAWMARAEALSLQLEGAGPGPLEPELQRLMGLSFEEWVVESKLPPRVAEWLRMTLECELGTRTDQFSALFGLAELRVFLFGGERALHVQGGNEKLIDALDRAVHGPKTLGARVIGIRRGRRANGQTWVETRYLKDGRLETVQAERVLVTVPWTVLPALALDPPLPAAVWTALSTLGKGQYVKVHLLVDPDVQTLWGGPAKSPFPVLSRGPLGVIYGPERAAGRPRIFTLLLYAEPAQRAATLPQDQLRDELISQLERLWPGFGRFVEEAHFYTYLPAAVAYWPKGRSPRDAPSQLLFSSFDGMYLAGDWLVSSHSEGAARAALRQADAIANDLNGANRSRPIR